jgi:hypothetical protein
MPNRKTAMSNTIDEIQNGYGEGQSVAHSKGPPVERNLTAITT